MKFLHVTDTHMIPPGGRLYGLDPVERLELCVADILRNHADAEFAVFTGDLAHRGEPGAYVELSRILRRLPMPVHLLLGNHDDRANFLAAFPGSPRDADCVTGGIVPGSHEPPAYAVVFLDDDLSVVHFHDFLDKTATFNL